MEDKYHILLVEDDEEIRSGIEIYLKNQGYEVYKAGNGAEGLKILETETIHLAILDIMMPVMDGITMLLKLREKEYDFPCIMLTAKSEEVDKIMGLNMGADDYITKPFTPLELLARVNAHLRRYSRFMNKLTDSDNAKGDRILTVGGLELNQDTVEVFANGEPVRYKRNRAKEVLAYLIAARGAGVSSGELCGVLWEDNTDIGRQKTYLRQYVQSLRESLDKCGAGEVLIHNRDAYSIDTKLIECDYYRYLSGDADEGSTYHGEFMSQYPWADEICAELDGM